MDAPRALRSAADERDDVTIAHREYDDRTVIAVDFGPGVEAAVDVVGETAIVVAGARQFEFEVPEGATDVYTNEGVLVVEADADATAAA